MQSDCISDKNDPVMSSHAKWRWLSRKLLNHDMFTFFFYAVTFGNLSIFQEKKRHDICQHSLCSLLGKVVNFMNSPPKLEQIWAHTKNTEFLITLLVFIQFFWRAPSHHFRSKKRQRENVIIIGGNKDFYHAK